MNSRKDSVGCAPEARAFRRDPNNASTVFRHFLWKRRPHFRGNDERTSDCDQKERKKLPARESGDKRRIRLAKIFDHDPENGVANEEQTGQHTVWLARASAEKPENCE